MNNRQELLAKEIATALNDQASYAQFLSFTRRVPEKVLRDLLAKSLNGPNINNRPGYFVTSVKGYLKYHEQ